MENRNTGKILAIDVYVWLLRQTEQLPIAVEGVYRHLPELIKSGVPVAYVPDSKHMPPSFAFSKLEKYLGRKILIISSVEEANRRVAVWLATGVDFCPPDIWDKSKVKKAAILHDAFSANGYYGEESVKRFIFGAENTEILFPISKTALAQYSDACRNLALKVPLQSIYPYSAPHSYSESVYCSEEPRDLFSYVGSIYKRKNVLEAVEFASCHHSALSVAGRYGDEDLDSLAKEMFSYRMMYYGVLSDKCLTRLYHRTKVFVNLSKDEGFSMTPMEAIIHGVPYIVLSDIPAHRENYDGYGGVYFIKDRQDYSVCNFNHFSPVAYSTSVLFYNAHKAWVCARMILSKLEVFL